MRSCVRRAASLIAVLSWSSNRRNVDKRYLEYGPYEHVDRTPRENLQVSGARGEIGFGIIGAGVIASQFCEGLAYVPGARLQAVASRNPDSAAKLARTFGARRTHRTYEDLCQDPDVDVVYVATPNEFHRSHSLLAIAAGKAVLCEKPFACNAAEAAEVFRAAKERGVFCMEGMWMRCSPAYLKAMALVRSGEFGQISLINAQLGFINQFDAHSRLFALPGGGALLDLAVYPLALVQSVFGAPQLVQAGATLGSSGVDETVVLLLKFSGGRQALVSASITNQLENTACLIGTRGRLTLDPIYFPSTIKMEFSSPASPRFGQPAGLRQRLVRSRPARGVVDFARSVRRSLHRRNVRIYPQGTGLSCEAAEVVRCLQRGLLESPLVTQNDTLSVLNIVDEARRLLNSSHEVSRQ